MNIKSNYYIFIYVYIKINIKQCKVIQKLSLRPPNKSKHKQWVISLSVACPRSLLELRASDWYRYDSDRSDRMLVGCATLVIPACNKIMDDDLRDHANDKELLM